MYILVIFAILSRLTVGSGFGSKYWNRPDPSISTLGIDPKPESIPNILDTNRHDPSRFLVPILEIESNRQEIENYVILPRISIFGFKFLIFQINSIDIV